VRALRRYPHGIVTDAHIATGVLRNKLRHADRRVHLDPPAILSELRRLQSANGDDPDRPLRLIGLRELRSHNSWMHNAKLLMRGGREHALRVHPDDAAAYGVDSGALARVSSKSGAVEVPVLVTDEMTPGTVALPHGWGHRGGWSVANAAGGVNVNLLSSSEPEDLEPLAGMAFLNGIPVSLEPVASEEDEPSPRAAAVPAASPPSAA
jgi:formate dehydrogenase